MDPNDYTKYNECTLLTLNKPLNENKREDLAFRCNKQRKNDFNFCKPVDLCLIMEDDWEIPQEY